mgnify:CR=1 FL=1|jgi:RNase P protein component
MTDPKIGGNNWRRNRARVMRALTEAVEQAEMILMTRDIVVARERAGTIATQVAKATTAFYEMVSIIELHE